jgi:hypothetical protein
VTGSSVPARRGSPKVTDLLPRRPVGSRYRKGGQWVEGRVKAGAPAVEVKRFSADYFGRIRRLGEDVTALSLPGPIVLTVGGNRYRIVP